MLEQFRPKKYLDSIQKIDFRSLKEEGIIGLLFDLDDTILPRRSSILGPLTYNFFDDLKERGFKISLLSNNFNSSRVEKIAKELGISNINYAFKPLSSGFNRAVRMFNLKPSQIAVIGDQLFMDVWGGNNAGMYTILVKPQSEEVIWFRKLMRTAEQWMLEQLDLA